MCVNPFFTEYCGSRAVPSVLESLYLQHIGSELDPGIDILWTDEGGREGGRERVKEGEEESGRGRRGEWGVREGEGKERKEANNYIIIYM